MASFEKDPGIRLTGPWARLAGLLSDSRFGPAVRGNIRKATVANAHLVKMEVRENIRRGVHANGRVPNAPLTIAIKGFNKPTYDSGGMARSVRSKVVSDTRAEIGFTKSDGYGEIAKIVHDGAVVPVTPAMRGMFAILHAVSIGEKDPSELYGRAAELWERMPGRWLPISAGTSEIVIQPRRFVLEVIEADAVRKAVAKNWTEAVAYAIAGLPFVARQRL